MPETQTITEETEAETLTSLDDLLDVIEETSDYEVMLLQHSIY